MSIADSSYQYYFGRYPETQQVAEFHNEIAKAGEYALRDYIAVSEEFEKNFRNVMRSRIGTFFSAPSKGPKICVLGNCQGPNIARAIQAIAGEEVSACGLEIMDLENARENIARLIKNADYVLACKTYSKYYEEVSPEYIKERYSKIVFEYSPIHFTGIHPDIVYLGDQDCRIQSPLGDYNSKIVVSSYLSGISIRDCMSLFTDETYDQGGFFSEFEKSAQEMRSRENALGDQSVKISDWFLDAIRKEPILYTINHPTSAVFLKFASIFLERIRISVRTLPSNLLGNSLSNEIIWPVCPVVARHHGLAYDTNIIFWRNLVPLSLEEFVWRSYRSYDRYPRAFLAQELKKKWTRKGG